MPSVPPRRVSRRHVVGLAAGILLAALAVVPAVTAQGGDGDHQDTVDLCHFADGAYEAADAPEIGLLRPRRAAPRSGRAGHRAAVRGREPAARRPVVVRRAELGRPRPGDPRRGLRRDDAASRGRTPSRRRRSGSATRRARRRIPTSRTSPRSRTTATSTAATSSTRGPSTRRTDWGDIIPPYHYMDKDGKLQTFPGDNWSEAGQAIYKNGCEPPTPPDARAGGHPILECVEEHGRRRLPRPLGATTTRTAPPSSRRATRTVLHPARARPRPADGVRGGPRRGRLPGRVRRLRAHVVRSPGTRSGQRGLEAVPGGSITVVEAARPHGGPRPVRPADRRRGRGRRRGGRRRRVDGHDRRRAGQPHGERDGAQPGRRSDDYTTTTICRNGDRVVASSARARRQGRRRAGATDDRLHDHEQREAAGPRASPRARMRPLQGRRPPTSPYWGYRNGSDDRGARSRPGARRTTSRPSRRTAVSPTCSSPGATRRLPDARSRPASGHAHVDAVRRARATANADSPACNPTLELRKVVVPADDPGDFELKINDDGRRRRAATGRRPAPAGSAIGEGTVSETAGPGTSLADYDSRVECTRNGEVDVSVQGTKVDGEVRRGDVVVCTFTNTRKGTTPPAEPPNPPNPPTPTAPAQPAEPTHAAEPAARAAASARPAAAARPRRDEDRRADDGRRRRPAHLDDDRDEPVVRRGGRRQRPQARRSPLVPHAADLADGLAGNVPPVHMQPRATRPRRVRNRHGGHRGGRVGVVVDIVRVGSEEPESNYRNNVAAAVARVVGPLTPPHPAVRCRTLTAAPRVLQSRRSSVVRLTARNRLGRPLANSSCARRGRGRAARGAHRRPGRRAAHGVARRARGLVVFSSRGHATAGAATGLPHAARRARCVEHPGHRLATARCRSACRAAPAAGAASRWRSRRGRTRARPPARAATAGSCRGCRRRWWASR